jgi:hypothetical protein
MTLDTIQILGATATLYGLGGALSVLLQARRMRARGTVTLAVTLKLRRPVAQDAAVRPAGEDQAQRRPVQPLPREPEYRARPVGDRVRRNDRAHAARDVAKEICV